MKKVVKKEKRSMRSCENCKPWFIVCNDDCPAGCKLTCIYRNEKAS